MTNDLPTPTPILPDTQVEEDLPVRQRATIAETRLTAAEWGLLSILTLMQFSITIDFIIIAPLGPQLMRVFGIDTEQFGYTVAAYAFGAGLSSFSAAFFLNRFDRKRALLVLFTGFTLGTFCCALAPGYHAMLAARFMTGIFGGVAGGVVLAIVGDAIPEIRRATAMGTVMSAFALASALGVPAGLWMAERGWHWPFFVLGFLCAVIIPFAIWLLPRSDSHLRQAASNESAGAQPERFRLLVYTNVLKDYIRSALSLLKLPEESVITFDHWCRQVYQQHIGKQLPWNQELKQPDFTTIRAAVRQRVFSGQLVLPLLDFVLVDEAQDLEEEMFALLAKASRHITVCLDNKQQIYNNGSTEAGILHQLRIRRRNISLIDAFRVSPYLVEVVALLIPDAEERNAFRNQTRQPQIERETPLVYFARNVDDEAVRLHDILRQRLLKDDKIAILVPQNAQLYSWAKRLHSVGVEVETPQKKEYAAKHDFNTNRPKLMTYHNAKGLTFDSVFLRRLLPKSFGAFKEDQIERLVFVALTRATKWAYFSTVLGNSCDFLEKLLPLERTRQLTVQRGDPVPVNHATTAPAKKDSPATDPLDFL